MKIFRNEQILQLSLDIGAVVIGVLVGHALMYIGKYFLELL